MSDRLAYTIAEVSKMLGISDTGVRDLVRAGEIPTLPLPGRTLIPAQWLRGLAQTETAASPMAVTS